MILRKGVYQFPQHLYLLEFRDGIQFVFFEVGKIVLDDIITKSMKSIDIHFIGIGSYKGKQPASHSDGSCISICKTENIRRVGICVEQYLANPRSQDLCFSRSGTSNHEY